MRIAHIIKHCNGSNGHVHVAVDLACIQARSGERVAFVSAGGTYEELLSAHDVELVQVDTSGSLRAIARGAWTLLQALRAFSPDVIHAHMMSSAITGYIASKVLGVPLVTTVHNSFDRHSGIMRLGKRIVAVSEYEHRLLKLRRYPPNRLATVLNGSVNSPRQATAEHSPGVIPSPAIVTLCGLHRRKAVGDAIRAFSSISPEAPGWNLVIIGDGPDREELERLARTLGIGASVHFLGSVLRPHGLLTQAQVFVSTSLEEPFGLAIAEARAAGCAVVATSVGGVPEVLDHGESGILVRPSRPGDIAESLRSLIRDPILLESWRRKALAGSDRFNVERMANDYLSVYCSAIASPKCHD